MGAAARGCPLLRAPGERLGAQRGLLCLLSFRVPQHWQMVDAARDDVTHGYRKKRAQIPHGPRQLTDAERTITDWGMLAGLCQLGDRQRSISTLRRLHNGFYALDGYS